MGLFGKKKNKTIEDTTVNQPAAPQTECDELPGLLTLEKFYDVAADYIRKNTGSSFAVCRTSVGNIGAINDTYGRESGNRVLRAAADALASDDSNNIVALDRSKFVTLFSFDAKEDLDAHIAALHTRLSGIGSVIPGNPKVFMNSGYYSTDGRLVDLSIREMVECAQIAESDASKRTHESIVKYTENLRKSAEEDMIMERDMRDALKKKQFEVCLQPKFDAQTNEVIGAKIMSRWLNPTLGPIGSYRYVPLFVKNGFILDLDIYLLERACQLLNKWKKAKLPLLPLAINVPRIMITSQHNMDAYVTLKKKYNVPDGLLELEFSERLVDDTMNEIDKHLKFFKDNGFRCSVKNFGAGNGDLSTITDLPIDVVKFSSKIFENGSLTQEQREMLTVFIRTAKDAGVTTATAGEVSLALVDELKALGCDIIQGENDTLPMSVADFEKQYLK